MFRRLFQDPMIALLRKLTTHFFLMEPDCVPIRQFWGDRVHTLARSACAAMTGSVYYGDLDTALPYAAHVNGNALYDLRNQEFTDLVLSSIDTNSQEGYDAQLYMNLASPWEFYKTRKWMHLFGYTRVIMNFSATKYNATELRESIPEVFLVHAGTIGAF